MIGSLTPTRILVFVNPTILRMEYRAVLLVILIVIHAMGHSVQTAKAVKQM
jgi:hypothetical protein